MKLRSFIAALLSLALAPVANAQSFLTTTVAADASVVWRDYNTNGIPSSGAYNPLKSDIRRWGGAVGGAINQLFGSQAAGANPGFTTQAALYAVLTYPANTLATVWNDTTVANRGMYIKVGASGSGSWSQVSTSLFGLPPALSTAVNVTAGCTTSTASISGPNAAPLLTLNIPACGLNGPTGPTGPQGAQVSVPGTIYATTAAGLAGTTNGQYFAIPSPTTGGLFDFYLNNSGSAVLKGTTADESQIVSIQGNVSALQASASTANYATGDTFPGENSATVGGAYFDLTSKRYYPQKLVSGWTPSIPFTDLSAQPSYAVDFRYGTTFPGITFVRSTVATNAFYTDAPGAAYQTFAANRPVVRSDYGMGNFIGATNYFLNSTAPVTQTITLTTGNFVLTGNGTGTLAVAAGTVTGTGFGTITTLRGNKQAFNISGAGSVTVTVTGSVSWAQLEGVDLFGRIGPTPLIVTLGSAVTRAPDQVTLSGTLLSTLQGTSGTFKVETAGVSANGNTNQLIHANSGGNLLYLTDSTHFAYYDGTNFGAATLTGSKDFAVGRVRGGIKWSPGSFKRFAGDSAVIAHAWSINNGTAITTASLGGFDSFGQGSPNGWFVRAEVWPYEQSDSDFVSSGSAGGRQDYFYNYNASTSLPKYKAARALTAAGISDTIIVGAGDSTMAGTVPATNFRASSWPVVMAGLMQTQLASQGITRVSTESWFGYSPSTAVPTVYDTRLTESGTVATYGLALGGDAVKISPGGRRCFAPTLSTDTYKVWYYNGTNVFTSNPYGQFTITDGVGGTVLQTVNSTSTAGMANVTVTAAAGMHNFCINAVGETHISGGRAWLSTVKEIAILLIPRSAFATSNFVQGGSVPEASIAYNIPNLAANLMIEGLTINDANSGASLAQVLIDKQTLANTVLSNGGDILYMTGAPTNFGVGGNASAAAQLAVNNEMKSLAYKNGAPFIDMYARYGGASAYSQYSGLFFYDNTHFNAAGYADMAPGPAAVLSAQ